MYIDSSVVVGSWARGGKVGNNWGDLLNGHLMHSLSGRPVVHVRDVKGWAGRPVYRVIGSGLGSMKSYHVIWGMGFMDGVVVPSEAASMICAVRGPRSRARLLELGIGCPEIYGDPAVLYPMIYNPKVEAVHDFGIVQHFRESNNALEPVKPPQGATSINIDICSGLKTVVDQIKSCRAIISSSLHGLICAHSYGIPGYWLKASDLPKGDDFKFFDYYASIGFNEVEPAVVGPDGIVDFRNCPAMPTEPLIRFRALIDSCPFVDPMRKDELIRAFGKRKKAGAQGTIFL
ncbi:polysaccharide pyruvyl transferase family protein [Reyranella sp.]|uniref:polysaccharide pyruvyl transferase family protein n=1 Tax=Reyranella sp. TaxID=1929291 RepID=UPI003D153276